MRKTLLTSAALFGIAFMPVAFAQTQDASTPASGTASDAAPGAAGTGTTGAVAAPTPKHHTHHHATKVSEHGSAHEPGTGESGPASARASNIDAGDSHSDIAPHLPAPRGGSNAGPWNYLRDAEHALKQHRTGEAQQALEMAETRLLDRSTAAGDAGQPSQGPVVEQVTKARQALGHGDVAGARSAIRLALNGERDHGQAGQAGSATEPNPPAFQPTSGAAPSSTTTAIGHSQPNAAITGNGTPSGAGAPPSGAGPAVGHSGGPVGTGSVDSAGGAK